MTCLKRTLGPRIRPALIDSKEEFVISHIHRRRRPSATRLVVAVLVVVFGMAIPAIGGSAAAAPPPPVAAAPAAPGAPGGDSGVAQKAGRELHAWAVWLLLPIAALVALPLLARRYAGAAVVVCLLVLLIGGFVFAQDTVKGIVAGFWRALGG